MTMPEQAVAQDEIERAHLEKRRDTVHDTFHYGAEL